MSHPPRVWGGGISGKTSKLANSPEMGFAPQKETLGGAGGFGFGGGGGGVGFPEKRRN